MIDPSTLQIQQLDMDELQQHPENANNGDVDAITESIKASGFYKPIIVQESTGYIIAGNHSYLAALKQGMTKIPGIVLDVTDLEAKRIMVVDNRTTRLGHDDEAQLANILQDLYATDTGLAGTGYSSADYQGLLELVNQPIGAADFDDSDYHEKSTDVALLTFTIMPSIDPDGQVYEFIVTRPGLKHMTGNDLNSMRRAFGQSPLSREELASYDVPDWKGR